ncbi:MAG: transporter [Phycisphaerales bacterium]
MVHAPQRTNPVVVAPLARPPIRVRQACAVGAMAAVAGCAAAASAQGQPKVAPPEPDKSGYTLFNPTPRALMREMSTDRPDTTESPYTVDAGHLQIEMSFADFSYDRTNSDSQTRHAFAVAPVLFKVGLLNNVDLQIGIDPYTREKTTDRTSDASETLEGFGDTVARLKVNLWGNDGGETAFALMPFVKFPTADGDLGNGNIEGGFISILAIELPNEFSSTFMIEFDFNRSGADDRYVVDLVHTATVGRNLLGKLGGYLEYAGFCNLNRDEDYRGYFDAGLTYGLTPDVQLDCGCRVGLTKAAEDFGVFAGISMRF